MSQLFFPKFPSPTFVGLIIFALICFGTSCTKAVLDLNEDPIELGEVTYDADIKTIMIANCTGCHGGATPVAGFVLTSYATTRSETENGTLLARIVDSGDPMPPSGLMSAEERQKVQKWADDGYPEN